MPAAWSTSPEHFDVPIAGIEVTPTPALPLDMDVALMLEAAAGSDAAFDQLVRIHQNALLNFFIRMGAYTDGEDLVQETFVRLFRYRRRYRPAAKFTTFLYHIARNVWSDRGRKRLRRERLADEMRREAELSHHHPETETGSAVDVGAALELLSPKLKEVIVLNIYQGLRYQEVADILEIPLGTVKSRINLAMAALREFLHED